MLKLLFNKEHRKNYIYMNGIFVYLVMVLFYFFMLISLIVGIVSFVLDVINGFPIRFEILVIIIWFALIVYCYSFYRFN